MILRVLSGLLLVPAALSAQTHVFPAPAFAPAFVDAGHWSIVEVRRLTAAGLAPAGFDAGRRVYSQREIGRVLEHAVAKADSAGRTDAAAMGRALLTRFAEEFALRGDRAEFRGSSVTASFQRHDGDFATGWGYWYGYPNGVDLHPPEPRGNRSGVAVDPALQWTPVGAFAVRISSTNPVGDPAPRLGESHASAEWKAVRLWAGRHAIGYGPGRSGGIVLSDGALFDGFGVQSSESRRLPWFLRYLGPVTFDFTLAQLDLEHSFDDVALLVTRGTVSPHARMQLGVTRAAMFGGEGNTPIDLFAIFSVLIGKHAGEVSELDNQVVAVDLGYRPPTDRVLPLRVYAEWGFEDSAGAYTNVPGVLAGIEVPVLPGFPAGGAGVEYTHFAMSCCDNPIWYRHSTFHDGWTLEGEPLGHPLGGHGRQWSVFGSANFFDSGVRTRALLFTRDRRVESLYTPDLLGRSRGLELDVEARVAPWADVGVTYGLESADQWQESLLELRLRALL